MKKIGKKYKKNNENNYSYKKIVYTILKISYKVKFIINYIYNHQIKSKSFKKIIL